MRTHKITWRTSPLRQYSQSIHINLDDVVSISEPEVSADTAHSNYYLVAQFEIRVRHADAPIVIKCADTDYTRDIDDFFEDGVMRMPTGTPTILSQFVQAYEAWTGKTYLP